MLDQDNNFIWRCAKCSCHFVNVVKTDGLVKMEKKCPKCKAVNVITLSAKEVSIQCKMNGEGNNLSQEEY